MKAKAVLGMLKTITGPSVTIAQDKMIVQGKDYSLVGRLPDPLTKEGRGYIKTSLVATLTALGDADVALGGSMADPTVNGLPVDRSEVWELPSYEVVGELEITSDFSSALRRALTHAGVTDVRFCLNSVYLDNGTIVSLDGHRLYKEDRVFTGDVKMIVASSGLKAALKALSGPMMARVTKTGMLLTTDDITAHVLAVNGTYPEYRKVLKTAPPVATATITSKTRKALGAWKALAKVTKGGLPVMIGKEGLVTDSLSLPCHTLIYRAPTVGINYLYLMDALATMPEGDVELVQDENDTFVMKSGDRLGLAMGMRI